MKREQSTLSLRLQQSAPRCQERKEAPCHFDPFGQAQGKLREKSFLDPSHSLGRPRRLAWWALRPFGVTHGMLCASHCFSESVSKF
jgi:hypothetical protein